jgi:hypothetical protein
MCLFLVLLWCSVALQRGVTGNSRNSRFGGFNSRLGQKNSRLTTLRELAHKRLIWLVFLTTEGQLRRRNRRISRHNGKNPEWDEAMLSTEAR